MSMCLCSTRSPCELEHSLDVVCWLLTAVPVQLLSVKQLGERGRAMVEPEVREWSWLVWVSVGL